MPLRINGTGTTYFGQDNPRKYRGVCQFCQHPGELESYETRLVFTVFFVPVLPLAKKQILNKCPRCTRHVALPYSKWQQARESDVEQSAAELARRSHDPDAAIRMHATYDSYQMQDDAARFADAMMALYGDVARVQFYLGAWYERLGRREQAEAAFATAHQIEPGNPTYRRAVAIGHIERGRPEEAEPLLESFRPPAETFEPPLFIRLADAFHAQGQYDKAIEEYKRVAQARPQLLQERTFRKAVRRTERALGAAESILKPLPWHRYPGALAMLGAVVLLAMLLGGSWYARNHRKLYVVNGLDIPISVQVDDAAAVTVPQAGFTSLSVAEGHHTAVVSQPALAGAPLEFEISGHWLKDLFGGPVYVLDPSRSAVVAYDEQSYAVRGETVPPAQRQWHVAEPFATFARVDYAFQEFPRQWPVSRNQPVRKSRVGLVRMQPAQFAWLLHSSPELAEKVMTLCEGHLQAMPDDNLLLYTYWGLAARQKQFERHSRFLAARLTERPVRTNWHRFWQTARQEQDDDSLVRQYDEWLASDPGNASLIYLRGRLERDRDSALSYYERAIAADPSNPFPVFSRAVVWLSRGELSRARQAMGEAVQLNPKDPLMRRALGQLRLATGDFGVLEQECRTALVATPYVSYEHHALLTALVAQGKTDEAKRHVDSFMQQIGSQYPQQAQTWTRYLQHSLLYVQGKFDELAAATAPPLHDAEAVRARYQAQFELGQVVEAPPGFSFDEGEEAYLLLCQAIVLNQRGEEAKARELRAAAIETLRHGLREQREAAEVLAKSEALERGETLDRKDLDHLPHDPRLKTMALVALADASPGDPDLLDLAEKLNFDRRFPYHFLGRTIGRLRERLRAKPGDTAERDNAAEQDTAAQATF